MEGEFSYRSVVGKLNYLEKGTRPDIAYATHECARFSSDPKEEHGEAIKHIVRYLMETSDKGIILDPQERKSLEIYEDEDFAGNWFKKTADIDASTDNSRSGFIILYAGCPLTWFSKLQTQVSLSTTEAEYIALS